MYKIWGIRFVQEHELTCTSKWKLMKQCSVIHVFRIEGAVVCARILIYMFAHSISQLNAWSHSSMSFQRGRLKVHGNVRDDPEQHWITLTSVQKWTQDFFERFSKSEWSYNIGVYGNVFCLDKSTRSPSFKVRIVAEQKLQKSQNFCTSGARAKDS